MPTIINLTKGQYAIVDDTDSDLNAFNWRAQRNPTYSEPHPYQARGSMRIGEGGKLTAILMHRIILGRKLGRELEAFEQVDHKDLNPLNNVRSNLRLATRQQNCQNRSIRSDNRTGFKGVQKRCDSGRFRARIQVGDKRITLGTFETAEEAYGAYCEAAKKYHGEFARFE